MLKSTLSNPSLFKTNFYDDSLLDEETNKHFQELLEKEHKSKLACSLMKSLDLPYYVNHEDSVKITDLYDILTDKAKLKELVFKLNNRTFI